MMEENRKGPGIFYAVTGVATLVVAIIGATFAYFSAAATTTYEDPIGGQTYNELATALGLTVTRLQKDTGEGVTSDALVPTDLDGTKGTSIANAVSKNCEANGYTGCHLYKIVATTNQNVANASILLDSLTITKASGMDTVVAEDWKYTFFTADDDNGTNAAPIADCNGTFAAYTTTYATNGLDVHKNAALSTAGQTYYLLIYLQDDPDNAQNANDAQNATGTYAGTVSLTAGAAGGRVTASFGA